MGVVAARKGQAAVTADGMGSYRRSGVLETARQDVGLSQGDLWLRYFALGGNAMPTEFEAFLSGVLEPAATEYDILVQALNERSMELGSERRWEYSER